MLQSPNPVVRRRRETIVVVCLTLLFGGAICGYFLLVSGPWFLALLATVGAVFLLGGLHYLVWGRNLEQATVQRPEPPPNLPPWRR
jgi:hypothetical protein